VNKILALIVLGAVLVATYDAWKNGRLPSYKGLHTWGNRNLKKSDKNNPFHIWDK